MPLALSILLATSHRPSILNQTLADIVSVIPNQLSVQIIIASNGSGDREPSPPAVDIPAGVQVICLSFPIAGKAHALNSSIARAEGDLIIFADDDISPSPTWLPALIEGSKDFPDCIAFCGPIEPLLPHPLPTWLSTGPMSQILFAGFTPQSTRGLLSMNVLPLGPNFAVRKHAVIGLKFREDLGPSAQNGNLSLDDVAFVRELRSRWCPLLPNGGFVYLPDYRVQHRIRAEQVSSEWIYERFFNYGRSTVVMKHALTYFTTPSGLTTWTRRSALNAEELFRLSAEANYYLGQIQQLRHLNKQDDATFIANWLLPCPALDRTVILSRSAETLCRLLQSEQQFFS